MRISRHCKGDRDGAILQHRFSYPFFFWYPRAQPILPNGWAHNVTAMIKPAKTVIIQSTFSGFQAYATSLPEIVVTGKNIPEAKTKLRAALQDYLPVSGPSALSAEVTYHIVY